MTPSGSIITDQLNVSNIDWSKYMNTPVHYPITVMPAPTQNIGIFKTIWSWMIGDIVRLALVCLALAMLYQLYQNYKNRDARVGSLLPFMGIVAAVVAVWQHYSPWIGGAYAFMCFMFLVQENQFKRDKEERIEQSTQQPIKPIAVKQLPNFGPPKTGLSLNLF